MISWKQFCDEETFQNLKGTPRTNFIFRKEFVQYLTESELALVYIQQLADSCSPEYVKVWYPKETFNVYIEKLKEYPGTKKLAEVELYESPIVSICCESATHNYVNKKLNIEMTICCKCFKPCKIKIK